MEVQSQLWKLNQDALCVRNISKTVYLSLFEYHNWNTSSTLSGCAVMTMTLFKKMVDKFSRNESQQILEPQE